MFKVGKGVHRQQHMDILNMLFKNMAQQVDTAFNEEAELAARSM